MDNKTDSFFMNKALRQARCALRYDEVPIGALVVDENGVIIGRGYNKTETKQTQTAHAEVVAIQKASKKIGSWRLNGCTIYVTLEPCLMCFGLIQLSRIRRIVYGAQSTLFGVGLSNVQELPPYAKGITFKGNVKQQECLDLLQTFFGTIRKSRKDCNEGKREVSHETKKATAPKKN